jgi:hypothetical protein
MTITIQSLVTAAAVAAAAAALLGYTNRGFVWLHRQRSQDEDIRAIKAEQGLLTYGVLACLKGLREQGCNGPVTEAIQKIERHLNEAAHQ